MKISYKLIQKYFTEPLPPADELARLLTFHAFEIESVVQVGDDVVIDVDVLANRSSDCLSHRGIARELSTVLGVPLARDPLRDPIPDLPPLDTLEVTIEDSSRCARYMAAVVRGVTVGPSPAWLVEKLTTLGHRSINNVVDATNFVMLQVGQPLHAFDLEKLAVDDHHRRVITVRSAQVREQITVLGGETYTLAPEHLLITDGVRGNPLAIAGIKGGTEAEVGTQTTDIIVESANFNYVSVRRASQALKLSTEASVRFQNEPSPHLVPIAMRDVVRLITEIAGGACVGATEAGRPVPAPEPVVFTSEDVRRLLGVALSVDAIERILVRLDTSFSREGERFSLTPPWERTDLSSAQDAVEEVGRLFGYENIKGVAPGRAQAKVNGSFALTEQIRSLLLTEGFSEVYTYTLRNRGEVELDNPPASDKAFLRSTLADGLRDALEKNMKNAPLLGLETMRLFELGPVFQHDAEVLSLALGVRAAGDRAQKLAEQELVRVRDALGRMLGVEAAVWGEPDEGVLEFSLEPLRHGYTVPNAYEPALPWNPAARYRPWSVYPFMLRDIAVWVPEREPMDEVRAVIIERASDLLVRSDLFDTFSKEGRTSYAFHLVFQSMEKTLTDEEVEHEMTAIVERMVERGWEVR